MIHQVHDKSPIFPLSSDRPESFMNSQHAKQKEDNAVLEIPPREFIRGSC